MHRGRSSESAHAQGTVLCVDEQGQTIVEYSYDAWGNVTFSESSLQNMTKASTLCFVSPFTYRGYCYDYDIELYYLQSRYYSAEIGRFINTDDTQIAIATQGEILGANLFAYCNNNPVVNVDDSGLFSFKIYAAAAATAAIISAVAKLVENYIKGYRGKRLFRGVLGASIGSAVNVVLLMAFIRQGTKGMALAALVAAAAQALVDFLEGVLVEKKFKWKQLTVDFILNLASNLIGNYIGGKIVYINGNWIQPQKLGSFFTKSYGKRIIAQTGIGSVISIIINIAREGWGV